MMFLDKFKVCRAANCPRVVGSGANKLLLLRFNLVKAVSKTNSDGKLIDDTKKKK